MTGFRNLRITGQLLIELFEPGDHLSGYRVTQGGVPRDARVVGGHIDAAGLLVITLASDEWPPTPEGCVIETLNTWIEHIQQC